LRYTANNGASTSQPLSPPPFPISISDPFHMGAWIFFYSNGSLAFQPL
jgi:hypothetical protein